MLTPSNGRSTYLNGTSAAGSENRGVRAVVGLLLWEGEPTDRATEALGDAVAAAAIVAGLLRHGHAINQCQE